MKKAKSTPRKKQMKPAAPSPTAKAKGKNRGTPRSKQYTQATIPKKPY